LRIHLTGQKDLHFAGEILVARGPRGGLRVDTLAAAEEPGRNHTSIIQDDEFVTAKEVRKIRK
jgi:hypothetical protein